MGSSGWPRARLLLGIIALMNCGFERFSAGGAKRPIGYDGPVQLGDRKSSVFLFRNSPSFEACDALVEVANGLFERSDRSDEGTEGDLHIVEIGAHQVEDIGHRLEAGVNFVVESMRRCPISRNSFCVTAASSSIELSFFLGIWMVVTLPA